MGREGAAEAGVRYNHAEKDFSRALGLLRGLGVCVERGRREEGRA